MQYKNRPHIAPILKLEFANMIFHIQFKFVVNMVFYIVKTERRGME